MDDQQSMTIMLIEDDGARAAEIEGHLRRTGLTGAVLVFSTGRDALEYLSAEEQTRCRPERRPPRDALLHGPAHSGELQDAVGQLKANERTRCIPVIAITSSDDPAGAARCYDIGCNACISPPCDGEQFAQAIQILGRFLSIVKLAVNRMT